MRGKARCYRRKNIGHGHGHDVTKSRAGNLSEELPGRLSKVEGAGEGYVRLMSFSLNTPRSPRYLCDDKLA
jgi:hypothetical protein